MKFTPRALAGLGAGLLAALAPFPSPAAEIHRLAVVVATTSDSVSVGFKEAVMGGFLRAVSEGAGAPDLWIDRGPALGISKRVFDATPVTAEFDVYVDLSGLAGPTLTLRIDKGWLNAASVSLYNMNSGTASAIGRYEHDGVADPADPFNRREFAVPIDKVRAGGPRVPRAFDKTVVSVYYPWYGTPGGPSGAWHQWIPGLLRYGAAHTPSAGFYDSRDEDAVRKHIRDAHEAGIDAFAVSWWGRGSFEDVSFRKMLTVAEEEYFPLAVYYESAASADAFVDDIRYILGEYGPSPSFLRVDGRPVIFLFGRVVTAFGGEEWRRIFERLAGEGLSVFAVADGLEDDLFLGDDGLGFIYDLFQGVHAYIAVSLDPASLRDMNALASLRSKGRDVLFAATAVPGYDDSLIRSNGPLRDRRGGDYYRERWAGAGAASPDWVLVTSYNEWQEGSEIEPSLELGASYLALTRDLGNAWNPVKRLRIIAGDGGTTDPAPGVRTYSLGETAEVAAVPDPTYDFAGWRGDGSGKANPLPVLLDVNRYVIADFVKIRAPLNAEGELTVNRSLSQSEAIARLSWDDNPNNRDIAQYWIYLVENGARTLLGATDASRHTFELRKLRPGRPYTFEIAAVTYSAREGEAASLTLR
jgi:glycoprotein endo-alpha-1,2-mannosidase